MDKQGQKKFAEPRGWALKWNEISPFSRPEQRPVSRNGRNQKKFAEPCGWSLNWCGHSLFGRNGHKEDGIS